METLAVTCDVAVLGGGLGGVAAALAACGAGYRVCLTEETAWIGGQCTAQGVSALDEHAYIESFGGTALYREFRETIRACYQRLYDVRDVGGSVPLNPGAGWVSRLCFEPRVGVDVLLSLLLPHIEAGRLQIHYHARVDRADVRGDRIEAVYLRQPPYERSVRVEAAYFLDATELGELLPLVGAPWVTGAESRDETAEPDARADGPAPELVQTFTFPFVVDYCPGEDHTIARPPGYEENRNRQPYTLTLRYGTRDLTYKVFEPVAELPGAFWTYRRILAADVFGAGQVQRDLAMINWSGNDFAGGNLIGASPAQEQALLRRAKDLALGLLYWLQTEVPRDDGQGHGYPGLRLRPDALGTADGLSQYPYIRESRRLRARGLVREQDVLARFQPGPRAALFGDTVGLGWYPMDIHGVPGDVAATGPTRPFQIPLAALLPPHPANLLPACKNLGVTHMTNGCYRLHPIEWNIGEAAGRLAAFCLGQACTPSRVADDPNLLATLQWELASQGVPLFWFDDLPYGHPASAAAQWLAVRGFWPGNPADLHFAPDTEVTAEELARRANQAGVDLGALGRQPRTRAQLATQLAAATACR